MQETQLCKKEAGKEQGLGGKVGEDLREPNNGMPKGGVVHSLLGVRAGKELALRFPGDIREQRLVHHLLYTGEAFPHLVDIPKDISVPVMTIQEVQGRMLPITNIPDVDKGIPGVGSGIQAYVWERSEFQTRFRP